MDSSSLIGAYLKKLRKTNHYTQEYVASQIDVIRQSYSHYETGRTTPPNEVLLKLANMYGISVEELIKLTYADNTTGEDFQEKVNNIATPADHYQIIIKTASNLSDNELTSELLTYFNTLPRSEQEDIVNFVRLKSLHINNK